MRSLEKFVAVYSAVYNDFNLERHPNSRADFKLSRVAALAEWPMVCA
jgi:putative transposase